MLTDIFQNFRVVCEGILEELSSHAPRGNLYARQCSMPQSSKSYRLAWTQKDKHIDLASSVSRPQPVGKRLGPNIQGCKKSRNSTNFSFPAEKRVVEEWRNLPQDYLKELF